MDMKRRIVLDNYLEAADRFINKYTKHSFRNEYFMETLMNKKETQEYLKNLVKSNKPFAIVRFGLYEALLCKQFLERKYGLIEKYTDYIKTHIDIDAGMFSTSDTDLDKYGEYVVSLLDAADAIAYWRNYPSPMVFAPYYCNQVKHIDVNNIYPFPFWHNNEIPDWQSELTGKRVVVVTAFSDTVYRQYLKRQLLWNDPSILPEFDLIPFKAVQTNGNNRDTRFNSWFQAYEYMLAELVHLEYDLALISCGSYGAPLAMALKKKGKCAIQWGGCFQLWFGISGKRWDSNPVIKAYINEHWTHPTENERPKDYNLVDGGSYW